LSLEKSDVGIGQTPAPLKIDILPVIP